MKVLDEASFVLSIEIHRDMSHGLFGLSQRPTLIVSLKDLIWITVQLLMLLILKEINFLNPGVCRMILN